MKKKLKTAVFATSLLCSLIGFKSANVLKDEYQNMVYAEDLNDNQQSNVSSDADKSKGIQLIKDLNGAIEKTVNSDKIDVDIKVGSTIGTGYDIRRNFNEDKKTKIIHMVDTVYDTVKGPQIALEYWFDVNKGYKYEYNNIRKKYYFSTNENGDSEREYLNQAYYLQKIQEDYINNENRVTEGDNENLNVDGKNVNCRVIVKHKEYKSPKVKEIDNGLFSIIKDLEDNTNEDESKSEDYEKLEIDMFYYIGTLDGKIYKILFSSKKGEETYTDDVYYSYPEKGPTIPKNIRKNAELKEGYLWKSKDITYVSEYNGKNIVLVAYDTSSKKVFKSKKKLIIPKSIKVEGKNYKVTGIGNKAFTGMKKLKEVIIKADIERIDSRAFANCAKLTKVRIDSRKLKKIGKKAFAKTRKITFKLPKSKIKKYKKLLKKSGLKKYKVSVKK